MNFKILRISLWLVLARHIPFFKKKFSKYLNDNEAFCILPWIHTHYSPHGKAALCCLSASHSMGNTNFEDFDKMWNNSKYRHIRKMMLLGQKPLACNRCHKNEKSHQTSFRKEINFKFSHQIDRVLNTKPKSGFFEPTPWAYMDIRFSNLCNFKCRTCDPLHSHLWFADMPSNSNDNKPRIVQLSDTKFYPAGQIEKSLSKVEEIYW